MPEKKRIYFKVFLIDFADVRAPSGFNQNFVEKILFSSDPPSTAPDQINSPIVTSAQQYFHASSDFFLSLRGEATEWIHSDLNNRDIPHWMRSMQKAEDNGPMTDWGESWPVIVAEALRGKNFTSSNYSSPQELRNDVLALPNGRKADKLVFLDSDVSGGGVKRHFSQLKRSLDLMSHSRIRNNTLPTSNQPWNSLWDPAWNALPPFLVTPILSLNWSGSNRNQDGTYPTPPPSNNDVPKMSAFDVILHELGHLAVNLPDLYKNMYGPLNGTCIMGYSKKTHFPPPFSSLARWKSDWLEYRDYSRNDHSIRLRPYESHNDAIRITNGAPSQWHYLCIANREILDYHSDPTRKPTSKGRGVLIYRKDLGGRRTRTVRGGKVIRLYTSYLRDARYTYHKIWEPGDTIGSIPPNNQFYSRPTTLRNGRGELWYTLDEVKADEDDLIVNLNCKAKHLLEDFHHATWTGEAGNRAVPLKLDAFGGPDGHVALQDKSMEVNGESGRVLYLHPMWNNNGRIRGVYDISDMEDGPKRLYLKLGMPDEARGSNGVRVHFESGPDKYSVNLEPGVYKERVIDFRDPGDTFTVLVETRGSARKDWFYILDGWIVPTAPRIYDFISRASNALWKTDDGRLSFGEEGQPKGEVSVRGWMPLHTGITYGPKVLFTHPNWDENGFVEGNYFKIPVPTNGAMFRAHLGWHDGRRVTSNGVRVSVSVKKGTNEYKVIENAQYDLYEEGSTREDQKNAMMFIEEPIPKEVWGDEVNFIIRVDADGSSAQDWLAWTEMAMTEA